MQENKINFHEQISKYSIDIFQWIFSLTKFLWSRGIGEFSYLDRPNLQWLYIIINQVCGLPLKLYLLICHFYPLKCDIISLTILKITQSIYLVTWYSQKWKTIVQSWDFGILNLQMNYKSNGIFVLTLLKT